MEAGMKKYSTELAVGVFVCIGIIAMIYLSVKLGDVNILGNKGEIIYAEFDSSSGITENSVVEVAGVKVGTVEEINLKDYFSRVKMRIDPEVRISVDSIASVRTKGIIGEKFIKISPGGSDELMESGGEILNTESSVDIEELISKYIFEKEGK
jgi:phospholipid/cholesterol/gamma-HCH transport system substrate-binding protein